MNPLVSVEWLKTQLNHNDLIILDASPQSTMSAEKSKHLDQVIPNAIQFNIKEKFTNRESEYPNTLPSPKQFEIECRKLGINRNSRIVVYDNLGIYTSPRVWWLFKVMGHEEVCVLDGGLKEWIDSKEKVTGTYKQDIEIGDFESNFKSSCLIDYERVKENVNTKEYLFLDARSNGRFQGVDAEPRKQLKSGHVPNSMSLPYTEVLENGKYKSKQELIEIFNALKLDDRNLIFSCGSGITACITLLASEMVMPNKTLLYDGSWTEWAMKEGLLNKNIK